MVACVVCVRGLGSTGVLFFWTAPVAFTTRGRGLTFNIARVLVRAPIDEPGFQPTDTETTQRCEVRALMPKCSPVATACVSSPKDWAVLMGSHMQQEVVISSGASTSGPHTDCVCINRNAKHKLQQLHVGKPCSRREIQRIFRALPGDLSAPMHD